MKLFSKQIKTNNACATDSPFYALQTTHIFSSNKKATLPLFFPATHRSVAQLGGTGESFIKPKCSVLN